METRFSLALAAHAPGPASAAALARGAMNAHPEDVAHCLHGARDRVRLDPDAALALWHGPRGHYVWAVAAVVLARDEDTRALILSRDTRKHVVAAAEHVAHRDRPAPYVIPEQRPPLVAALLRSRHLSVELGIDVLGADRSMDAALLAAMDVAGNPDLVPALVGKLERLPSGDVTAFLDRDDVGALAQTYPAVAGWLAAPGTVAPRRLATMRKLPVSLYESLTTSRTGPGYTPTPWEELATNPDVPTRLLRQAPVDQAAALGRVLADEVGDRPDVTQLSLRLTGGNSHASWTIGELVDTAVAVAADAATAS